ncbi:MAG: 3'-5' exonuclease [Sulfurovum sp.]|nr:3'-5' exonuclease [Sulfurovum sp.]
MIFRFLRQWQNKRALKSKEYIKLFEPYFGDELVVLDTETTGLNPKKDEIISIGAVIIRDDKIRISNSFECFLKPSGNINHESIKIHHIRECDLVNAVEPEEAIKQLLDFIGNRPIVGYYISFDHKIISRYTKKIIGSRLPNPTVELSSMYYKRYRKSSSYEFVDLKFDTIMNGLGLPFLGKHDALNDAIMSAMIYLKLKSMPEYKGAFS